MFQWGLCRPRLLSPQARSPAITQAFLRAADPPGTFPTERAFESVSYSGCEWWWQRVSACRFARSPIRRRSDSLFCRLELLAHQVHITERPVIPRCRVIDGNGLPPVPAPVRVWPLGSSSSHAGICRPDAGPCLVSPAIPGVQTNRLSVGRWCQTIGFLVADPGLVLSRLENFMGFQLGGVRA